MKCIKINPWVRYGKLIIIKELDRLKWRRYFECECDCWNINQIRLNALRQWKANSCWCGQRWNNYKHWMTWTKIFKVFLWLKSRCNNPNVRQYKDYGWRWIKCLWNDFEEFYKDMWESYKEWLSIDRIDNNWNYSKENCRWATRKEQARNTRRNVIYKWKCLKDWCEELWLKYTTVYTRINRAWKNIKEALELNNK